MSFYKQFEEIKKEIKELYLKTDIPFILSTSFGKDSTLQLLLVWETLLTIPKEQRTKKVFVISSDTLVEMDAMSAYISTSLELVAQQAKNDELPIEVIKVVPDMKERFWWNVLGKGNPPVVPKSKRFRWCTGKLKQAPIDRAIKNIQKTLTFGLNYEHDVYLFLGTRDAESIQRKNSMDKFSDSGEKFGKHSRYDRVCAYYPIRFIDGSALWAYLFDYETLPWGMPLSKLEEFYPEGVYECSLKTDGQQGSCGGGRNGCWVCTFVKEDKMLQEEIQKGNSAAHHLYEYKKLLMSIRNDARYRESTKRVQAKQSRKRLDHVRRSSNQYSLFESTCSNDGIQAKKTNEYESFNRAEEIEYSTGSLTFECRKLLLEYLLYIEQVTQLKLIDQDEFQSILDVWREEGYHVQLIQPRKFDYDGAVVFDSQFCLNEKETLNSNPQFWITREFDLGKDELLEYLSKRQKETGKSFYYNLTFYDFGPEEEFVYNTAAFLVCQAGIQTEQAAGKVIDKWLYPEYKGEAWDWDAFAMKYIEAAKTLISQPDHDVKLLARYNKILDTLGYGPILPVTEHFLVGKV
ncbi:hypothetical protein B14911_10727 [Bacillus sp. NRRL B-14911]|uniref:hypothetical protein n=1 Tax=Bacillus sp. NRRL B-14911 TaxID=313627 RepID=UPI00006B5996|nr:hypothetical protein [Bacillus sp. NRRL B-14911]EAR66203.1 hypothetical protein B14911_10727 [Bacillus sp. NRRL B-14911]